MHTAWVRLSRTCQNACLFCNDAANLDGTIVELDVVKAEIDAAKANGVERIVLSGGEPMLSKHFFAALKYAKSLGLYVAVTSNGRVVKSRKIADMLAAAGLDEARISVHSGSRARHDALAGSDGAWLEGLQALRFFGTTKVHTVMVTVLSRQGSDDLGHLMHLGMMGGMKEMELRRMASEGAAKGKESELRPTDKHSCDAVSEMWFEAKEEVIHLRAIGFDNTRDLGQLPTGPIRQADRAALELLRQRVGLTQPPVGLSLLGEEDMAKDCVLLAQQHGGLHQAGIELAGKGAPIVDAPWCVGGTPFDVAPDVWADAVHYGEGCEGCPMRAACPGLPRKMKKLDTDVLQPLPGWTGVKEGRALVVGGSDALLRGETLPALAEALAARGLQATYAAEAPTDLSGLALIVCGDASSAHAVLAQAHDARVVVLDTLWGDGLADLPRAPDLVESNAGEGMHHLKAAGIHLRTVRSRAYPAPPRCFEARTGGDIVHLDDQSDDTLVEALMAGGVFAFPPSPVDLSDPAARTAHARRLRWLTVAAASGCAVVGARGPGVEDHVRHMHSGWLAAAGDRGEMAGTLRHASDPARRATAARHGRAVAATSSVQAWADDLVDGRLPNARRAKGTETMPWPPY